MTSRSIDTNYQNSTEDETEKILLQLKQHIEKRKMELENSFNAIFDRLKEKKSKLFQSLDSILQTTEEELRKTYQKQDEYKTKRSTAVGRWGSPEHVTFEDPENFAASLNLNGVVEEKVEIPFVTISKEPLELDFFVENYFQIKMITNPYVYKKHPKWHCSGIKGLSAPRGMCVCQYTGAIFLAESGRNCVQIFDKTGAHIKEIRDLKMSSPKYVCANENFLYVSCWDNKALLKLNNKNGIRLGYHHAKEHISGIIVDKYEDLYCCIWKQNIIGVWNKDLVKKSEIKLDNLFITENTQMNDLCYFNKIFYVLFTNTCFPVQTFNKKGDLVRCIVKDTDITNSKHIGIDQYANIILSDSSENERNIKIFSNNGETVHSIPANASPGKGKGKTGCDFDGIGWDQISGNIYICDSDRMYAY